MSEVGLARDVMNVTVPENGFRIRGGVGSFDCAAQRARGFAQEDKIEDEMCAALDSWHG